MPISPYYLGCGGKEVSGCSVGKGAPILTHLFFADDAILFGKATEENMYQLMEILNAYSKASGQRINLAKSGVIGGKFMDYRVKTKLAGILQMQLWENPGKYLGLPAEWSRSKTSALNWIKEKIEKKIEGWKENLLNQAGKEVLIKSVLQAIPTYVIAIVRFPKNLCQKICASIARFWWRNNGKDRGIHWKSWKWLTRNKSEGGLGFKDFSDMNSTILAKQAWRIVNNPESLWVKILKALYFPNEEFLRAKRKRNGLWVWSSLLHGRDEILKSARWTVGSGENIYIVGDSWLASGVKINDQIPISLSKVSEIMEVSTRSWNIRKIRECFPSSIAIQILQTPIAWIGEDRLWWPHSKTGDLSVKSCYFVI